MTRRVRGYEVHLLWLVPYLVSLVASLLNCHSIDYCAPIHELIRSL